MASRPPRLILIYHEVELTFEDECFKRGGGCYIRHFCVFEKFESNFDLQGIRLSLDFFFKMCMPDYGNMGAEMLRRTKGKIGILEIRSGIATYEL